MLTIRGFLLPASAEFIRQRVAFVRLVTRAPSSEGMGEAEFDRFIAAQLAAYAQLLGEYPSDIWAEACEALPKLSPWFPMVADFEKFMRPRLEKRRRALSRLEAMLRAADQPQRPAFVRESQPQRLAAIAESCLRHYGPGHPKTIRAQQEAAQHQALA